MLISPDASRSVRTKSRKTESDISIRRRGSADDRARRGWVWREPEPARADGCLARSSGIRAGPDHRRATRLGPSTGSGHDRQAQGTIKLSALRQAQGTKTGSGHDYRPRAVRARLHRGLGLLDLGLVRRPDPARPAPCRRRRRRSRPRPGPWPRPGCPALPVGSLGRFRPRRSSRPESPLNTWSSACCKVSPMPTCWPNRTTTNRSAGYEPVLPCRWV